MIRARASRRLRATLDSPASAGVLKSSEEAGSAMFGLLAVCLMLLTDWSHK